MKWHKPIDRNGMPIGVGDLVRIVGSPDLSARTYPENAEKTVAVELSSSVNGNEGNDA
jgi:hypothetical protein